MIFIRNEWGEDMYITQKNELNDSTNGGIVYISVSESANDSQEIIDFKDELSSMGYKYFLNVINKNNINDISFLQQSKYMMSRGIYGIVVLDDQIINDPDLLKAAMFECGFLQNSGKLLMINKLSQESFKKFNELPIRQHQLSSIDEVLKKMRSYIVLPLDLFENKDIDKYSAERIFYIKFIANLDIRYGSIRKILERFNDDDEESNITYDDVLRYLSESIRTGLTFICFGKKDHLTNEKLWPYKDEMKVINKEFPVRSCFNRVQAFAKDLEVKDGVNANEDTDVVASLVLEFVVPNHKVIGTSFQPFFEVIPSGGITSDEIIEILVSDGVDKDDIRDINHKKIYFPFSGKGAYYTTDNFDDPDLQKKYGKKICFFYPK